MVHGAGENHNEKFVFACLAIWISIFFGKSVAMRFKLMTKVLKCRLHQLMRPQHCRCG